MENFSVWLLNELDKRGWQPADLAKKARISKGSLSNILNSHRKPGPTVCVSIAQALGEPPEKVFRLAGLLPALPSSEDETLRESIDILKNLSPQQRKEVLRYLRFLHQSGKEE